MKARHFTPVLVIGAGLSGLACARALADRGVAVTVLEGRAGVAQPWRSRHPGLRLNIHRRFASLPGLAPPEGDGVFLKRDTVIDYLERYAAELGVPIRYGAQVEAVVRDATGWHVSSTAGEYSAEHVVFATGRDREPHVPDWPGRANFGGEVLHSADFGDAARFDGRRLLVVGAGNSGTDVLNHLARHRPSDVRVSVRHGPAIVPMRVFGFPLHRLAPLFARMPTAVLDPAFRITQRVFLGNLRRHGLPSHPDGGGTRLVREGVAFAVDDGFAAAVRSGRFRVVPELSGFEGDRVRFADGTTYAPDTVIAATGYRTGLDPLLGRLGVLDGAGVPRHPMGEADPANPGLWFTGFRPIYTGYFDAARIAGDRIADAVAAGMTCAAAAE